jgi:CheY-like chemotaxis protein
MPDHEDLDVLPLDTRPFVLVVEDEVTPRSIVTRMVRTLGYRAGSCPGGAAALRFLRETPGVSLVLADLGMPRMDGGELAERIWDFNPRIPVALMAGRGDAHVDDLRAGYADLPFIAKPVALGDLAELLFVLLGPPAPLTPAPKSMGRVSARRRPSDQKKVP